MPEELMFLWLGIDCLDSSLAGKQWERSRQALFDCIFTLAYESQQTGWEWNCLDLDDEAVLQFRGKVAPRVPVRLFQSLMQSLADQWNPLLKPVRLRGVLTHEFGSPDDDLGLSCEVARSLRDGETVRAFARKRTQPATLVMTTEFADRLRRDLARWEFGSKLDLKRLQWHPFESLDVRGNRHFGFVEGADWPRHSPSSPTVTFPPPQAAAMPARALPPGPGFHGDPLLAQKYAVTLRALAASHIQQQNVPEAMRLYHKLIHVLEHRQESEIAALVAATYLETAELLQTLGEFALAGSTLEELISRCDAHSAPWANDMGIEARFMRGNMFVAQGDRDAARRSFEDVACRASRGPDNQVAAKVAHALMTQGSVYKQHDQQLAGDLFDMLIRHFENSTLDEVVFAVTAARGSRGSLLQQQDNPQQALRDYETGIRSIAQRSEPRFQTLLALLMFQKGLHLRDQADIESAMAVYDEILERFGNRTDIDVRRILARTQCNLGCDFLGIRNPAEGRRMLDEVIQRYGDLPEPEFAEPVSKAMLNLSRLNAAEDQIGQSRELLQQIMSRFGETRDPVIEEVVQSAQHILASLPGVGSDEPRDRLHLAMAFVKRSEWIQSLEILDDLILRNINSADHFILEIVARGMNMKGNILGVQNDPAAVESWNAVVARFGNRSEAHIIPLVAEARLSIARYWRHHQDYARSLSCCDAIIAEHLATTNPNLAILVAGAFSVKGTTLIESDDPSAAMLVYQQMLDRFQDETEPEIALEVARARFNQATYRNRNDDEASEIAPLDDIVARYGERGEAAFAMLVAASIRNKGFALARRGDHAGALAACEDILERYADRSEPEIVFLILEMMVSRGRWSLEEGECTLAIEMFDDIIARYGDHRQPLCAGLVAEAMLSKIKALDQLGLREAVLAEFREIDNRYGDWCELPVQSRVARARLARAHWHHEADEIDEARDILHDLLANYGENDEESMAFLVNQARALLKKLDD